MKAKANLSRTIVVLAVGLVGVAVALLGVGLRSAKTQTTPTYYKVQTLGALPGDTAIEPYSSPHSINDFGHVVGEASFSGSSEGMNATAHAFLYKDGEMQDLGTLGGPSSYARAINNSGQVVGSSADSRAFLCKDGQMQDLGTLGGGSISWANGINTSGQVVGSGTYNSSGYYHAFLYGGEGSMQDLGVLASGENHLSWANDINDFDQVVGYSDNDYNSNHYNTAFLYQNEEMIDLGTRLHPDNNGNIWNLGSANGINNKGQIVTDGSRKETDGITYRYSALLLSPTSDTPPADDTEAPSPPTITSPQNNSYDKVGSFSVSGSAEAASTVELFEGTTSTGKTTLADSSSGAWSIDLGGVSEGTHTYSAKAKDAAGNTSSASNTVTVTVDNTPPLSAALVPPAAQKMWRAAPV